MSIKRKISTYHTHCEKKWKYERHNLKKILNSWILHKIIFLVKLRNMYKFLLKQFKSKVWRIRHITISITNKKKNKISTHNLRKQGILNDDKICTEKKMYGRFSIKLLKSVLCNLTLICSKDERQNQLQYLNLILSDKIQKISSIIVFNGGKIFSSICLIRMKLYS